MCNCSPINALDVGGLSGSICMRKYRLYRLASLGSVVDARWVEAAGDEDVAEFAAQFGAGSRCEIWERDRLVGMTEPFGAGTPTFAPHLECEESPYHQQLAALS